MVNFYRLWKFIKEGEYDKFIDEFLRTYYHEFIHLFFRFRLTKVCFKDKKRKLHSNEKIVDLLAILIYKVEITHIGNWGNEIFKGEF